MFGKSDCPVFTPQLDETPVPCETYYTTDCVYASDKVRVGYLGIEDRADLSKLLDKLICRVKEQEDMIVELKNKINRIQNGSTW